VLQICTVLFYLSLRTNFCNKITLRKNASSSATKLKAAKIDWENDIHISHTQKI